MSDTDKTPEDCYYNILKAFCSVFVTAEKHLLFVLLIEVTKFLQVSVSNRFNYSNDTYYEIFCGIA